MYQLVNPYISGQFNTSFEGSSPIKAATKCWESLSSKFTNCIPNFAFSLQDGGNKLHHFLVKEKVSRDGEVSFNIKPYTKTNDAKVSKFLSKVSKLQEGGKRKKKDDDSSSSSDSDELNRLRYEHIKNKANNSKLVGSYMWYWSYYPTIYDVSYYDSFYIPTLVAPYMPYINVNWLP